MLQPIMQILNTQRIVLASGSPRRKQILENIGLKFEVIPSTFEETLDKSQFKHPWDYVQENARLKALEVANRLNCDSRAPDLVIGADTVVAMDNIIFEKPRTRESAIEMLTGFSGRSHTVFTGMALLTRNTSSVVTSGRPTENGKFLVNQFHDATEVFMTYISSEIASSYTDTGEPMDKAGGYGIQGIGGTLVEGIKGDYFNVMGIPLHRFSKELYRVYT